MPLGTPLGTGHSRVMDISALAFQNAPIGLAVLENRVIRQCNLQFARTFGGPTGDVSDFTDVPLARYYPSIADYARIGERALTTMRDTGRYSDERVMKRADGTLFWCRARGQSVTPDDPFRRGVWSFTDLSEERPLVALTTREREVAILTCRGMTSKEIGLELGLSYRTIEVYRARLLEKFNARKLAELVAKLSGMPL
ncbi:MAG: LuxR C-terminal-related transcriptional regulator [Roseovarius sp.]